MASWSEFAAAEPELAGDIGEPIGDRAGNVGLDRGDAFLVAEIIDGFRGFASLDDPGYFAHLFRRHARVAGEGLDFHLNEIPFWGDSRTEGPLPCYRCVRHDRFMTQFVYGFAEGSKDQKDLLGGKGANLAEMTKLGLPVPPGFTITTEACRAYMRDGHVPPGLRMDQGSSACERPATVIHFPPISSRSTWLRWMIASMRSRGAWITASRRSD